MENNKKYQVKILYVEDDESLRSHLKFLLKPFSDTVFEASDGREGLEIFQKHAPELVITDIMMPVMDGIRMAEEIKRLAPETPIILYSSVEKDSFLLTAINLGIEQFIVKDMTRIAELKNAVEVFCKQIEMKRELARQADRLRKFSAALEHSGTMVTIMDTLGNVKFVNDRFSAFTGYKSDDIVGSPVFLIKDEEYCSLFDALPQKQEIKLEYRQKHVSGRLMYVMSTITSIAGDDGKATEYIEIMQDITERKRIERDLQIANEHAQKANKAKSAFLANMSHELRTPLNGVIGMSTLLIDTPLSAEQREYVLMLRNSGESLLKIINNILDISSIEDGKIRAAMVPFSLSEIIRKTINFYAITAHSKNIALTFSHNFESDMLLMGDSTRLQQILNNIVGNALKFTEKGSVSISAELSGKNNDVALITFSVADTGIGIEPDKIDHVFEKFTQADSTYTRKYGGTGLGLAISKELVELLGGSIRVQSTPGVGSTFSFELPFKIDKKAIEVLNSKKPETKHIVYHDPSIHEYDSLNILLAEDNIINQKLIVEFLSKHKHFVKTALNGDEAVKSAKSDQFDLILMDVEMPVMNGFDATTAIREHQESNGGYVPIMAITAHTTLAAQQKCYESGMDDVVIKPIDFEVLLSAIDNVMAKRNDGKTYKKPCVDLSIIVEGFSGNELLIKNLIRQFLDDLPHQMNELKEAIVAKDRDKTRFLAHKIKSSMGNFGADKARQLAQKIENASRDDKMKDAYGSFMNFEIEMKNIENFLNKFLKQRSGDV